MKTRNQALGIRLRLWLAAALPAVIVVLILLEATRQAYARARPGGAVATAHRPVSARARNARPGRFCETLVGRVAGSRSSNVSQVAAPERRRS